MKIQEVLEYLKTQGVKPEGTRGRGGANTVTGKIMTQKSVKEKKAAKRKAMFDRNTTPAGMDTSGNPYRSKKQSTAKVGDRFGANITKTKKATGVYPRTKGSYKIQKGDTLSGIAKKSGTTVAKLMALNPGLKDPNKIRAGAGLNLGTKGTQGPKKEVKRPVKKDFKLNLPPYDTLGAFVKGGKVTKAVKGKFAIAKAGAKAGKDAFDVLFSKIKGPKADFLSEKATDLVKKFDEGKIKLPALKGELRKRMGDSFKKIKRRQDEVEEAGYLKEYRDKGKKVFPKKKRGGSIKIDEMQSDKTTRGLKTPPAGAKGRGLRKLPTAVRNKMGYKKRGGMLRMSGGGSASGFGRAAMRPGKDPRSISKT
tara:strand:+ start:52 stop:1146 length:1095 start_codon:yes stop_codon:yes gene_type:complete